MIVVVVGNVSMMVRLHYGVASMAGLHYER